MLRPQHALQFPYFDFTADIGDEAHNFTTRERISRPIYSLLYYARFDRSSLFMATFNFAKTELHAR